jgi:hypothetical protein
MSVETRSEHGEAMASRMRFFIACCGLTDILDAHYEAESDLLRLSAPGLNRPPEHDTFYPTGREWEEAVKAHILGYAGLLAA